MRLNVKIPWNRSNGNAVTVELNSLSKRLGRVHRQQSNTLLQTPGTLAETAALQSALTNMREVKNMIDRTLSKGRLLNTESAVSLLAKERDRLHRIVTNEGLEGYFQAGMVSVLTINMLYVAENKLGKDLWPERLTELSKPGESGIERITISSDLLYQIHHALFPAEKMLVASGQRCSDGLKIGAIFEVTGQHGLAHVRANAERLARALIAMDLTNTHFALWLHSHPGFGKECTRPSEIDLRQHQDWLNDYSSNLVSAIMVEDRWIRFWGTALDSGRLEISVIGPGVTKEESLHETVYRLES